MKPFTTIAVVFFAVIGLIHVLRLIFGWEVRVNSFEVPVWFSIFGAILPGLLALMVWKEKNTRHW